MGKLLYNEMRCIRGEINTQEYTLVKNNNLWSGYFCDFIPLMDSNNNINIPILKGKYIRTTSNETGKYNKSYMNTMNDKCGEITNKFFGTSKAIKIQYPIKSFKYNYSQHLDRSIKEQKPQSKNMVPKTKSYYQKNLQETTLTTNSKQTQYSKQSQKRIESAVNKKISKTNIPRDRSQTLKTRHQ